MLKGMTVRATLAAIACVISLSAYARADGPPATVNVPAGNLVMALESFSRQTQVDLVYQPEQLRRFHTQGVSGTYTPEAAVRLLLKGTPLELRTDPSGAMVIAPPASRTHSSAQSVGAGTSDAQESQKSGSFRLAQANQGPAQGSSSVATADQTSAGPVIQEVLVTAQKRGEERLQDVPVPITVLNAQDLADTNQALLKDYYSNVPGLSVTPGVADRQPLSIRGISTGGYTTPTVGVMIDDVPFGGATTSGGIQLPDLDPGDLERIEVLRGPQGTLYGANSMGGLIKFVTREPSTDGYSGRFEAGTSEVANGAEPGFTTRGTVNVPVTDTFAFLVSGFRRQDPGYIDNPVTGIDGVNEAQAGGMHLSALWKPSADFTAKLSALYQTLRTDGSNDVDVAPGLGELQQNYIRGAATGGTARTQAYSATLNWKLGAVELTSVTGYNINHFSYSVDFSCCDGPTVQQIYGPTYGADANGAPLSGYYDVKKFSQELRLTGHLGSASDWLLGTFYTHESAPNVVNELASDSVTGQILGPFFANSDPVTYEEYAAFANWTYHVTDRFDLQIGGRESHTRNVVDTSVQTGPAIPIFYGSPSPFITPGVEATADTFTYLFTPSYKIDPDVMVYARLASGFRPGLANTGIPLTVAVPRQSSPDTTRNYEIGVKGDYLDHRLSIDTSLYYIDWRDIQIQLETPTFFAYETNGSRAKSEGVEFSASYHPWTPTTLSGWVSYDDAALTEAFPAGSPAYGVPGDRLPNSSRWSGNLALEQDFPLWQGATGFFNAQASYVGDRIGVFEGATAAGDPKPRQVYPSYTKTDLRLGYRYDTWTVNLYLNNLADTRGLVGGGIGNFPPDAFIYITPRNYGVSIAKTF